MGRETGDGRREGGCAAGHSRREPIAGFGYNWGAGREWDRGARPRTRPRRRTAPALPSPVSRLPSITMTLTITRLPTPEERAAELAALEFAVRREIRGSMRGRRCSAWCGWRSDWRWSRGPWSHHEREERPARLLGRPLHRQRRNPDHPRRDLPPRDGRGLDLTPTTSRAPTQRKTAPTAPFCTPVPRLPSPSEFHGTVTQYPPPRQYSGTYVSLSTRQLPSILRHLAK